MIYLILYGHMILSILVRRTWLCG